MTCRMPSETYDSALINSTRRAASRDNYHPMRINRFSSRRSAQSISLHLQHQISPAVIRHMHVRSIIAVLSIFVGEHRTQDCSLSSPFSFLRSPAVVSRRSKAHLVLGTFVSVGRTRTLLFALFMKKKRREKRKKDSNIENFLK
ncbi:hypothetical protein HDV62DRAFT_264904 [Trichoderma sp. SZMC 28011]